MMEQRMVHVVVFAENRDQALGGARAHFLGSTVWMPERGA